jgi:hypothetical protein
VKQLIQLSALLCLILGFSSFSQAAILIEPVVGYSASGKLEFEDDSYSGGRGLSYGGRLGYQNLGFQLGVDYLNSSLDMDHTDFRSDVALSEWAAFVGFRFPLFIRLYAGYIFSAHAEATMTDDLKMKATKGTGSKFGIGFTGIPFIDINLEMRRGSFADYSIDGQDQNEKINYSAYMIGISIPINL